MLGKGKTAARVEAVNVGRHPAGPKESVPEALVEENWGIARDSHAGIWPRQISLLAGESVDACGIALLGPGFFGENLLTRGLEFAELRSGDQLAIGEVVLEITLIGWDCPVPQPIAAAKINPGTLAGALARVLHGGEIRPGAAITIKEHRSAVGGPEPATRIKSGRHLQRRWRPQVVLVTI